MEIYQQLNCPISPDKVNEHTARITALLTVATLGVSLYLNSYPLSLLLTLDFFIRAFTPGLYSPLRFLSQQIGQVLGVSVKLINARPKRFAAGVGFILSLLITLFQLFSFTTAALLSGFILIFFASLEGLLGFCMGCMIYTYVILPIWPQK